MARAKKPSMLSGTLDLIVLQLLDAQPSSGYDLAQRIQATSSDVLTINAGSLYPALYRLEQRALIRAAWRETDTGRRARIYSTTAAGRRQLDDQRKEWLRFSGALSAILRVT
jgi:PadR family transcriptional regulator PadR